jgi:hypothetical protein
MTARRVRRALEWSRANASRIAALLLTVAAFVALDRQLGAVEGGGPYRQEIPRPIRDVMRARAARHIVLGCSTSNWFPSALTKGWRLGRHELVDGHMSDCLQACTLAEVRRLVQLGRHFETATFGVNAFEYCEEYRERRSMQEVELMPLVDSWRLARVYLHSEEPLRYAGGWLSNQVSRVYGNTMWLQRHHRKLWFGNESLDSTWFSKVAPERTRGDSFRCDYAAADRDYGLAATRAALEALEALADRVQLVVLPERALAQATPEAAAARELFRAEQRELASGFERTAVIDLLEPKLLRPELFRDGAHLNRRGVELGARLLAARVPKLAAPSAAASSDAESAPARGAAEAEAAP